MPRILARTLAVLVAGVGLCVTSVEMQAISAFEQQIPLFNNHRLEISGGPGCPINLPELACSRISHEFPWAFRLVYWAGDAPTTLVSIPVPRR
jgi:hypothetical protein